MLSTSRVRIAVCLIGGPAALAGQEPDSIRAVLVHPVVPERFACREHFEGEYTTLLDAIGTDCFVLRDGSTHDGAGARNEDYHIWDLPVLAPFDGTVANVMVNPVVNIPGNPGAPPATTVIFRRDDGVMVGIGHIDKITIAAGDRVTAGQPFARVSNNGVSSSPHLHIGAWRDQTPLQIRWDQRAMGRLWGRRRPPS